MKDKYYIKLRKIGESIISFNITAKNFSRDYPMYLSKELETTEEFISRRTKDFLDEIKDYREVDRLTKI